GGPLGRRGRAGGGGGRQPVVERRLARRLAAGAGRYEPLAVDQHLPHDQSLARLAARVEGNVAEAAPVEEGADGDEEQKFLCRSHGTIAVELHVPAGTVSVRGGSPP